MSAVASRCLQVTVVVMTALCCAGGPMPTSIEPSATELASEQPVLVGPMTRADIEAALPHWVSSTIDAEPDPEAAAALGDVAASARVTIVFGSWCEDSQRELSRLWKALDMVGGDVAFSLEYIAVDRSKAEPVSLVGGREILYVPTLIVEHDGREVGRIVESAPSGVEIDLLALLDGASSGWISARDDLPAPGDEGRN